MTRPLVILVGTMTGNAQLVAEEVQVALAASVADITVRPFDQCDITVFAPAALYLVCTSTYGQGDVPDNARALFEALEQARPDLRGVQYGVIGLGDRTYAGTFCFGGRRFDALLGALGATRIGEPLWHDASTGGLPEEEAVPWAHAWIGLALAAGHN